MDKMEENIFIGKGDTVKVFPFQTRTATNANAANRRVMTVACNQRCLQLFAVLEFCS